jgi:cyanophycinase-like exopeptidase
MKTLLKNGCTILSLVLSCWLLHHAVFAQKKPAYTSWIVGSAADVSTATSGGALLMGGGTDNDDAMRWMLQKANGGDVVVIRATGQDGYNAYLYALAPCNSVETILINSRTLASNAEIVQKIRNAEALFIAGGDQAQYVSYWKDTPVEDAINYLINTKGVVVGGTSAGCAIQGKAYFDAMNGTIRSEDALANPYNTTLTLQRDNFLNHALLANTITDTHYNNPDRRGRHTTFLARMLKDWGINPKGIGVNEKTAVCVEPNGTAKVFGNNIDGYAYFLQVEGGTPETCAANTPLTWDRAGKAVKVYKILGNTTGSNTFDLNTWASGVGGTWEYFYACNGAFLQSCGSTGGTGTYCASKGTSSASEWIDAVQFRDLSNTSGNNNGYADFTSSTIHTSSLEIGQSYSLYVRPGFSGTSYTEYWKAWIDYNQDGDFADAGEEVMNFSSRTSFSRTATIPTTAKAGKTRMRVSMSYRASPTPCETFEFGEVEDYSVTLFSGVVTRQEMDAPTTPWQVYPNPAKGKLFVQAPLQEGAKMQVSICNLMGQVVYAQELAYAHQATIDIAHLPAGNYVLLLRGAEGIWSQKLLIQP